MLSNLKRYLTAEGAQQRSMESAVKEWLRRQLLTPAPNRPRDVTLSNGRTCHINPCAVNVEGTEYIDLDVRKQQGGKVIMTVRIDPSTARYITTLWR